MCVGYGWKSICLHVWAINMFTNEAAVWCNVINCCLKTLVWHHGHRVRKNIPLSLQVMMTSTPPEQVRPIVSHRCVRDESCHYEGRRARNRKVNISSSEDETESEFSKSC